jgi:RNA recognition motif-containing protein
MDVTVYVGNLAKSVSENELRSLFSQVGDVTTLRIIKDDASGESLEYGFVTMSSQNEADRAVSRFNHYPLGEQPLRVGLVRPRGRSHSPGSPSAR